MTITVRLRRVLTALFAVALLAGAAACEATQDGDISAVEFHKSCPGDSDFQGSGPYDNQVFAYVKAGAGQNYDIVVSANGSLVAGWTNVAPDTGRVWSNRTSNYRTFDVAVVPSDGSGISDTYHQAFNAC